MNFPPFRPGSGPLPRQAPQPQRQPQEQAPQRYATQPQRPAQQHQQQRPQQRPSVVVPANVLRALIGQSRKRCEAYVEMMRKFGQGLAQLDMESRQMLAARRSDPESMRQLEEYFTAVRTMAERSEQHVAQQIHYEVQFQKILQAWLYGRPVSQQRHPDAPPLAMPQRSGPERLRPPSSGNMEARQALAGTPQPDAAPSDVIIPPPSALSGYAAHAAAKARANRPEVAPPQAAPTAPSRPALSPQAQVPAARPSEKELVSTKPLEKSNGPAAKPLSEEPSAPSAPSAEEGSG